MNTSQQQTQAMLANSAQGCTKCKMARRLMDLIIPSFLGAHYTTSITLPLQLGILQYRKDIDKVEVRTGDPDLDRPDCSALRRLLQLAFLQLLLGFFLLFLKDNRSLSFKRNIKRSHLCVVKLDCCLALFISPPTPSCLLTMQ